MGLIGTLVVGLIVGAIARFLLPGEQKMGWILTCLLGVGGSMAAGYVGQAMGWYAAGQGAGWIASVVGALVLLALTVERYFRARSRYAESHHATRHRRFTLRGWRGWAATLYTGLVLLLAFVAPVTQLGIWAWRARGGTEPAVMAGHSLGEFTALVCAGALDYAAAVDLVRFRGQVMQAAVPAGTGAMVVASPPSSTPSVSRRSSRCPTSAPTPTCGCTPSSSS